MPSGSNTRSRGFASMDQQKQREIARKGGRAAHEKGTAHEFTADEARAAGRKGGERVSANREHMSRIGRLGGKSSASRRRTTPDADMDGPNGSPAGMSAGGEAARSPEMAAGAEGSPSSSHAPPGMNTAESSHSRPDDMGAMHAHAGQDRP